MVIHGTQDEIVPFWHGQELYLGTRKEYRFEPYWVESAGHNNVEMLDSNLFFRRLCRFLDQVA